MFPRRIALLISSWMGVVAFHAAVDARRLTLANLTLVYGDEKSRREINKMGRTVFRELGRNVVDAVRLPSITVENVDTLVTIEGLEYLELAYQKGRGVIAVSAHLGNFELLGSVLALKGFAVTVVAAPVYDSRLDELLMQHRVQSGLTVVNRDQAFAILRALKKALKRYWLTEDVLGKVTEDSYDKVIDFAKKARLVLSARMVYDETLDGKKDDAYEKSERARRDLSEAKGKKKELRKTKKPVSDDMQEDGEEAPSSEADDDWRQQEPPSDED